MALIFVLSLKIVNCRQVTTSIKKTLVNQIQENTATAELVRRASLFIIDEYTMGDKKMYETIDRTFCDIMENDLPYGGKIFLHSRDWVSI